MRLERWRPQDVSDQVWRIAEENANRIMDDVALGAQMSCPIGEITRAGKWKTATIAFTPKTGRNRGQRVSFLATISTKREPGDLLRTIRRVNKPGSGNVRVYAGNRRVNYAHFVERGTVKMRAKAFLRPAFQRVQPTILDRIKNGES